MKQEEIKELIKSVFNGLKIVNIEDRWERNGSEWKLCYLIYGLSINNIFIPQVRLVWPFNQDKTELVDRKFIILTSLKPSWQTVDIGTNPKISLTEAILATSTDQIQELGQWIVNNNITFYNTDWQSSIDQTFKLQKNDQKIDVKWQSELKQWQILDINKDVKNNVSKLSDYKFNIKESVHWKPSNLKGREQLLIDNWQKILSQEVIEGDLELDQWALKVDSNKVKVKKINGSLILSGLGLTEIPEWIGRIEEVNGSFDCDRNQLTDLINSPQKVNWSFWCHQNQLSSLKGLSKWIGGHLWCNNNLKQFTLNDIPKDVTIRGKSHF